MKTHDLKIWPEFYQGIQSGAKLFELRINDRGYALGDKLVLREWSQQTGEYTGLSIDAMVTFVMPEGFPGVTPGWVLMGIQVENGAGYEPFGPEWEREMMKKKKKKLVELLRAEYQGY